MLSLIEKRIWKNRFCSTCDVAALDGFGVEYGVPHKTPMAATGSVDVTLASGADLVIAECGALPGTVTDKPNAPHMEPEICARLAVEAGAGQMVLTHFGAGAYTSIPQRMNAVASARSIFPSLITGVDNLEIVL